MKPVYFNTLQKGVYQKFTDTALCACVGHHFLIFGEENSPITGKIKVEDVVLEIGNDEGRDVSPSKLKHFSSSFV